MERIGVGITTRNRPDCLAQSLSRHGRFSPGVPVVVVDDASTRPARGATFRFDSQAGIAVAKNKCLELLDDLGVDHFFLFDDDCFPRAQEWWKPYVESPEPHLMYCFTHWGNGKPVGDSIEIFSDGQHVAHSHPRGCMIYIHRSALERVGGMDTEFRVWGGEHVDWSNRVHAAGLTTWRYGDVAGSRELVESLDERLHHLGHTSTVPPEERKKHLPENRLRVFAQRDQPSFRPWSPKASAVVEPPSQGTKRVVLGSFFNSHPDPQRGKRWTADFDHVATMATSAARFADEVVVLTDCLEDSNIPGVSVVQWPTGWGNPLWNRWTAQYQWLREHPEVGQVWVVDTTDTEAVRDPFALMEPGKLYVGYEEEVVGCKWMRGNFPTLSDFIDSHASEMLYNCGLVGGSRQDVMAMCHRMGSLHADRLELDKNMGLFNVIVRESYFAEILETGPHVCNVFKSYEDNGQSVWMHK